MKIIINNFGPISSFEFDLEKDFHLIVGSNNVGKSYAITILYLLLRTIGEVKSQRSLFMSYFGESDHLGKILEKIKENQGLNEIVIDDELKAFVLDHLNALFLAPLSEALRASFDSIDNLSNQFSKKKFSISLITKLYSFDIVPNNKDLKVDNFNFKQRFAVKIVSQNRNIRKGRIKTYLYFNKKNDSIQHFNQSYYSLIASISTSLFEEAQNQVKDVHYLPASRSGLYQALSAFGQIVAELSKNRSFLTKKIELPGIAQPLSDYFLRLSEIRIQKRSYLNKPVNSIAEEIERDILHGVVDFDPKTKRLIFLPDGTSLRLDLSSTSSMVSELSPIVSYLRYVLTASESQTEISTSAPWSNMRFERRPAKGKHLIFIEEPEAHLHPEVQVKITEIFSKLVRSNVKIIITSHSNYIFNKVNNLILEKKFDIDTITSSVFKKTNVGSVGIQSKTDQLGIDDDNFLDVAALLFEEKAKLIQEMNIDD